MNRRTFLMLSGGMLAQAAMAQAPVEVSLRTPNIPRGVWPVMYTPFTESGNVDNDAIHEMVDFYVSKGVAGLFAGAYSGEIFNLSQDEMLEIARQTVKASAGRIGVVAGANFGKTLEEQAQNLRRVYDTGVDVAVVLVSRLPSAENIASQLLRLHALAGVPLGLYECPVPETRPVPVKDFARVAQCGGYFFIKETSSNVADCGAKVLASKNTPLRVFPASLKITPEVMALGAAGHCGLTANVCPELVITLCNAKSPEERDAALRALRTLNDAMMDNPYPSSGKYLLQKRGLHLTTVSRMEGSLFNNNTRKTLDNFAAHFDFTHT